MEDHPSKDKQQALASKLFAFFDEALGDPATREMWALLAEARTERKKGRRQDELRSLLRAILITQHREGKQGSNDYFDAVEALRDSLASQGLYQEAITASWYIGQYTIDETWLEHVSVLDRARCRLAAAFSKANPKAPVPSPWVRPQDKSQPSIVTEAFEQAADELESAGLIVRAAIALEQAARWSSARALWSRLAQSLANKPEALYEAGLAQFNMFRCSTELREENTARRAARDATQYLEEAADRFEREGHRERAFDCFQVLIELGRATQIIENVILGYTNRIRILREDQLRQHALRTYEEAIITTKQLGETMVAATLAREMAAYARTEGERAYTAWARKLEADLWQEVATKMLDDGRAADAEQPYLLALGALGEIYQLQQMGELYKALAKLPVPPEKQAHYQKAAARFEGVQNEKLETRDPENTIKQSSLQNVWHVDLIEWESAGSASEVCADMLLDRTTFRLETTRRRIFLARLIALNAEQCPPAQQPRALCRLAGALGQLRYYMLLSVFEKLATHQDEQVRIEALVALQGYQFKRTFTTVRQLLNDPDEHVAEAAINTLRRLQFPHAIDQLSRIYRESTDRASRSAALTALSKIDVVEAAEILIGVMNFGSPDEREHVKQAWFGTKNRSMIMAYNAALQDLSPVARTAFDEIFRNRDPIS